MALAVVRLSDNASLWELGRGAGVTRFRYLTHPELVKQVCLECLHYHDTVWEIGLGPEPPLHPMCACTMEPEFDKGSVLGQDPDGEPLVSDPAPALQPGEFLARTLSRMPAKRQAKALGPTKAKLLRSGAITADQLVSRIVGERTVHSLLAATGLTPAEVRLLGLDEIHELVESRMATKRRKQARRRRRATRRRRSTQPLSNPGYLSTATGLPFVGGAMLPG